MIPLNEYYWWSYNWRFVQIIHFKGVSCTTLETYFFLFHPRRRITCAKHFITAKHLKIPKMYYTYLVERLNTLFLSNVFELDRKSLQCVLHYIFHKQEQEFNTMFVCWPVSYKLVGAVVAERNTWFQGVFFLHICSLTILFRTLWKTA